MVLQKLKLRDVCEIDGARNLHRDIPYIGMEDIQSNTGRFLGKLDPRGVKSSTFYFTSQHLLYGRLRPYLNKVLLPSFHGHCSTEIFPLRPNGRIDKKFLFYWITSEPIVERINKTCTGARMPRANMKQVLDLEIQVPSLQEQKRIVAVLAKAFEATAKVKESAQKNLANARELFESGLQNVFDNPGDGWEKIELSDLCEIKHGFAFDGDDFDTDYAGKNSIVLTPGNFNESASLCFTPKNTKRYKGKVLSRWQFSKGDLVVVMTDLSSQMKILGKPAFIEQKNILHNQRIGKFVFKDSKVSSRYIYYYLQTKQYLAKIRETATGTMVKHTAPKRILNNSIYVPPMHMQIDITARLDSLSVETRNLEAIYNKKISMLEELKKSILRKAFSGELAGVKS